MATNWNVKDAYNAIIAGKKEDIIDLGHRFPLALSVLSKIGEANPAVELINALPEHVTVRKIEQILKGDVEEVEAAETAKDVVSKTAEAKTETEEAENDYSNMNATQLSNMLKDAGVYKDCIKKMGGAKKQQMLDYIEKYGVEPVEEEEADEEVEEEQNPYAGKTAVELFKEAKKRGIKVKPKQDAEVYEKLLKKNDEENAAKADEEEDDWGDDEEEEKVEEKPKKAAKAKKEKKATKQVTKAEEDDDEDDDWDI